MSRLLARWDRSAPARFQKARVNASELYTKSILTMPEPDLAGDIVVPSGIDWTVHQSDPCIDLEHRRTPFAKGMPVAWARASLSEPGAPYAVEWAELDFADEGQPPRLERVPIGTEYFDKSCRLSMQVFALREQDALPGSSLEFEMIPQFAKAIGWSDLENRKAYRFEKCRVHRWTVCAKGVCPQALTLTKSVAPQVPTALAKVLTDRRVNVGGRWEPLHPTILKALTAEPPAKPSTVRVEQKAEQVPETILKAREPFHGGYWQDHCPECGTVAKSGCRCIRNDRRCANGHIWERLEDGMPALLDTGHGKIVKAYGGETLEEAEQKRRGFTSTVRVEQKAMGYDDTPDDDLQTATMDAVADDMNGMDDGMGGSDMGGPTPTAKAAYDLAQSVYDLCEQTKQGIRQSEHKAGRKEVLALCAELEKISRRAMLAGHKVSADVADDSDADMDAETPDEEADGDDTPDADEGDGKPGKKKPFPDDVDDEDMEEDEEGVLKGIPLVFRKAVKRFSVLDVQKAQEAARRRMEQEQRQGMDPGPPSEELIAARAEFDKWARFAGVNV